MNLTESHLNALRGLAANKLRAALTMLGIIIGVAAVIVLISFGQGVEQYVTEQFQGIGSNLLFVFPGTLDGGGSSREGKGLSDDDAAALADPLQAPDVLRVAPEYSSFTQVERGRENTSTQVSGVTPVYAQVREWPTVEGDFLNEQDVRGVSRVAVLGQTVVETLFADGEYPIGQTIKIHDLPFRVVGVLEERGGSGFGDEDNVVLVPLTTAQERLFKARGRDGRYRLSLVYAQAASAERMDAAAGQITQILRDRHDISYRDEDDFSVVTQADLISAFGAVTSVLTIFLGAIAGISLLVGGIGIMNIMLVSVTERTREIGLRKAVGAKRRDILSQFLVEAVVLAFVGGLAGIALGAAGAAAVSRFQPDLPIAITWDSVLLATSVSLGVGLFFGIYPAARASRLNPIDALRYE